MQVFNFIDTSKTIDSAHTWEQTQAVPQASFHREAKILQINDRLIYPDEINCPSIVLNIYLQVNKGNTHFSCNNNEKYLQKLAKMTNKKIHSPNISYLTPHRDNFLFLSQSYNSITSSVKNISRKIFGEKLSNLHKDSSLSSMFTLSLKNTFWIYHKINCSIHKGWERIRNNYWEKVNAYQYIIHSEKVLIGHLKKSNILAKITKIQEIPLFQGKGILIRSEYPHDGFIRLICSISIVRERRVPLFCTVTLYLAIYVT